MNFGNFNYIFDVKKSNANAKMSGVRFLFSFISNNVENLFCYEKKIEKCRQNSGIFYCKNVFSDI